MLIGAGETPRHFRVLLAQNADGCRLVADFNVDVSQGVGIEVPDTDQLYLNPPVLKVERTLPEAEIGLKVRDGTMKEHHNRSYKVEHVSGR